MLRAVRFAAQLGFEIEEDTWKALKDNAELISKISAERIREELQKLIMSDRPEKISFLAESGLMENIFPMLAESLKTTVLKYIRSLRRQRKILRSDGWYSLKEWVKRMLRASLKSLNLIQKQ